MMLDQLSSADRLAIGDALALYVIEYRDHLRWYEGETRDAEDIFRIARALGVVNELRQVLEARVSNRESAFVDEVKRLRGWAQRARLAEGGEE